MSNINDLVYHNTKIYDDLLFESDFDFDLFLEMNKAETVFRTKKEISFKGKTPRTSIIQYKKKLTPEFQNQILDAISKDVETGKSNTLINNYFRTTEQIKQREKREEKQKQQAPRLAKRKEKIALIKYALANKNKDQLIADAYSKKEKIEKEYSKAKEEYEKGPKDSEAKKRFANIAKERTQQRISFLNLIRQHQTTIQPQQSTSSVSQPIISKNELNKLKKFIRFEIDQRSDNGKSKDKLENFLKRFNELDFEKKLTPKFIENIKSYLDKRQKQAKIDFKKQIGPIISKDDPRYKKIKNFLDTHSKDDPQYIKYHRLIYGISKNNPEYEKLQQELEKLSDSYLKYNDFFNQNQNLEKDDPRYKSNQYNLIKLYQSHKRYQELYNQLHGIDPSDERYSILKNQLNNLSPNDPQYKQIEKQLYGISKLNPEYKKALTQLNQIQSNTNIFNNQKQNQSISTRSLARREAANIQNELNPIQNEFLNNLMKSTDERFINLRQKLLNGTIDINKLLNTYNKIRSFGHNGAFTFPIKSIFGNATGLPYGAPSILGFFAPDLFTLPNSLNSGKYQWHRNIKLSKMSKDIGNNISLPWDVDTFSTQDPLNLKMYQHLINRNIPTSKLSKILKSVNKNRPNQKKLTSHDLKQNIAYNIISKLNTGELDLTHAQKPDFIGPPIKLNTTPNIKDLFITPDIVPTLANVYSKIQQGLVPSNIPFIDKENLKNEIENFKKNYQKNPENYPGINKLLSAANAIFGISDRRDNAFEEKTAGFVNNYINNGFNKAQELAVGLNPYPFYLGPTPEQNLIHSANIHKKSIHNITDPIVNQTNDIQKTYIQPIWDNAQNTYIVPALDKAHQFGYDALGKTQQFGQNVLNKAQQFGQTAWDRSQTLKNDMLGGTQKIIDYTGNSMNYVSNKAKIVLGEIGRKLWKYFNNNQ